ncbi:hypothetical protein KCM76_22840 [Zooshikella marina]|uniref:replication protein P n=1 Tax=Zooshikella ganghwensis TaxID=202772 RepID=UPI001BAF8E16|nr:replication protein P [Zooshikella ganghwensis]MBU2708849.1 hypothetical protein [Zooshikella ganghwensis]
MKTGRELVVQAISNKKHQHRYQQSTNTLTRADISELFVRMVDSYGQKWSSQFGVVDKNDTWLNGLNGLTQQQLAAGFERCIKLETVWPPTLPQFRKLCIEAGCVGLPNVADAYEEACLHADNPTEHKWSHEIVYLAGKKVGWYELRGHAVDANALKRRFNYAYESLKNNLMTGNFNPSVSDAIEDFSRETLYQNAKAQSEQKLAEYMRANNITQSKGREVFVQHLAKWREKHAL